MIDVLVCAWRAALNCLHPRVLLWCLLPLLLAGGATFALGWLYWESAVAAVRDTLEAWAMVDALLRWLDSIGAGSLRMMLAPLIVLALALPVVVIASLLAVAWLMTPVLTTMVARRRFPGLERRHGAAWWQGVLWSLACATAALLALGLSLPLWLVPPLAFVLPPLIWGWLTCRVFAFDVLADHASADERRLVLVTQRWPLLAMGLVCGLLGAAPALLWAAGAASLIFAPLLIVVAVALYTLVFAFSALWFAHFALGALARLRSHEAAERSAAAEPKVEAAHPPPALQGLPAP